MITFPDIAKSRVRKRLLNYFFSNPSKDLYVREAAAILKEDPGNLSKELSALEGIGIFCSKTRGRGKYFSLNKQYPLYKELKAVVFKTIGIEGTLKGFIDKTSGIKLAFIYGSFAQNKENASSDIDLLLVGSPDEDNFMAEIEDLEKKLQREINYNIYPENEFKSKLKNKDSFIFNILKRKKIVLKGNPDGIQRPA